MKILISDKIEKGNKFQPGDVVTDASEENYYTIVYIYFIHKSQNNRADGWIIQTHELARSEDWLFAGLYAITKVPGEYSDAYEEELTLVAEAGKERGVGFKAE